MELVYLLFIVLLLHYIYFLSKVLKGLKRLSKTKLSSESAEKISVIIPLRNEEENVEALCKSLDAQSLSKENYKIIFVDDNSNDKTLAFLKKHQPDNSRIIELKNSSDVIARKKKAVNAGIAASPHPIIVTTDADCRHNSLWLETLLNYFEDNTAIVAGPVDFISSNNFFEKFQRLEFAGLILTGAGLIGMNKPTICSAANLAYRKKVFEEVGGFEDELNFTSGDDDLFLQKVASKTKYDVKFAFSKTAVVKTIPQKQTPDFLQQRKRWASKYLHYENKVLVFQIILLALFYIGLLLQLILGLLFDKILLLLLVISIEAKIIIEHRILSFGTRYLFDSKILSVFFLSQLVQISYIIYSSIAGIFGNFKWKGEKVKR